MQKMSRFSPVILLLVPQLSTAGVFSAYDARSAAMGGTGVASAQIASAPFYNPAMLAAQRSEEDFSLLAGIGVNVQDNDNLLDDLEAIATAYNNSDAVAFDAAATSANGKNLSLQGNGFIVLGFAGERWSAAVRADKYAKGDAGFSYAGSQGIDSTLDLAGVEVSEVAVALAGKFGTLAVGIMPKKMNIVSYQHSALARDNEDLSAIIDTLTTTGKTEHGSMTNLDAGIAVSLGENIRLGLVQQNVLSETYQAIAGAEINFKPITRAGIAYTGDTITLAVDMDLAENDPLIEGGEQTQYMAAGVEVDVLDFMQLRAGYNKNIAAADTEPTLSAGLGINFIAFQLDLAALKNNQSVSGFIQLGVRF